MSTPEVVLPRRRHPVVTSLAVLRLLLARLRTEIPLALLIATVVLATGALVSALPRRVTVLTDESLTDQLASTPIEVRSLTAETLHAPIPRPDGDPFEVVRTLGVSEARATLPPALADIVGPPRSVVDTVRYRLHAYPGDEDTAIGRYLTLRLQDGIEDHLQVVSGSLPRPTGLVLTGPPSEDHPLPQLDDGEELQVVDGLVAGERVPVVQVAITQATADRMTLDLGDRVLATTDFGDGMANHLTAAGVEQVAFEVSAIMALSETDDPFWFGDQRLHVPAQRDTGVSTDLFGFAMVPTGELRTVPSVVHHDVTRIQWRLPVAPGAITAANLEDVRSSVRALEAESSSLVIAPDVIVTRTGLTSVLDEESARRLVATNALALAAVAVVGVALTAIALVATLAATRRREATGLVRGRGASRSQLATAALAEASIIAVPAGVAAWFVAAWLAGGPAVPAATVGVVLVVTGVLVVLVAAAVNQTRRPLRELLTDQVRVPGPSLRRLVGEILVVLLAIAGAVAMGRRGVDLTGGVDPLVAVVPVLVAVAVGLVTVRLHRVPLAAAARAAGERRGFTVAYALRRAVRDRANGAAVLVVLLSVSLATFAAGVEATIARGQTLASWEAVGAPVRVSVPEGNDLSWVAEVPGVRGVSFAGRRVATVATASETGVRIDLVMADPETLAGVGTDVPPRVDPVRTFVGEEAGHRDGSARPAIPAVASSTGDQRVRPGDVLDVTTGDRRLLVQVVALRDRFLGFDGADRPFVVVPRGLAEAILGETITADIAFVDADAGTVPALRSAAGDRAAGAEVRVRSEVVRELRDQPLVAGVRLGFRLAAVLALLLGALALVVVLTITTRPRARELALLTTVGIRQGQGIAITLLEVVPALAVAVLAGALVGQTTGLLLEGVLDLGPFTGTPTAAHIAASATTTGMGMLLISAGCVLLVLLVALRTPRDVVRILREGTSP